MLETGKGGTWLTPTRLARFKAMLLARRRELLGHLIDLSERTLGRNASTDSGDYGTPSHFADYSSDLLDHDLDMTIAYDDVEELRHVELALDRIRRGRYGICEECDRHIPLRRLLAIPHATLCVECKSIEEREAA